MLRKWRTRHNGAARLTVVAAACAVALPTAAVAQDSVVGGQNGSDGQSTKASPTGDGIPYPVLEWLTPLEHHDQSGGDEYEPVFDSEGHVLYQGINEAPDPNEQTLVAIDRTTGEVDWSLAGVSAGCGVVASDDGMIYGTTATIGADSLLAIDAATGTIVDTHDPQSDSEGMNPCFESLRLTPDGTLVNLNNLDFDATMHAFDTTGGSLSTKWVRQYNVEDAGADGESTSHLARPVISADGSAIYHCRQVPEELRTGTSDDLTVFEKLDPATGDPIAELPIIENAPCHTRGVIAIDGGAIVSASGTSTPYEMMRISDSGSNLSIEWSTTFSRDEDVDESGIENYPTNSLSLSGDTIVFRGAGGGIYSGVDMATGTVDWQYRASSFNNGYDNAAVDRHGNVYISTFGGAALESFDGDGNPRFAIEGEDLFAGTDGFGVQAVLVGPDGGIILRGIQDGESAFARIGTGPSQRVAGGTRYDTAAQIALGSFSPGVDTVFLAVGTNFPDALTGGPLAAHLDAPVLLTDTNTLPSETDSALGTLRPNNVIALGGTTAVSNEVLADAGAAADDANTDRYAGGTRYETAAVIADKLPPSDTVYLAVGTNYPDTLAGGPATDGAPILLTRTDSLPTETAEALAERSPANVIALGGPVAVSEQVLDAAAQAAGGADTDRLEGGTRYGTGVAIAQSVVDAGDFSGTVYVAVGTNYPDAVSAASAAEADGAPIVLTDTDELPAEVADWLSALDGLEHVVILGGTTAISDGVADALAALAS